MFSIVNIMVMIIFTISTASSSVNESDSVIFKGDGDHSKESETLDNRSSIEEPVVIRKCCLSNEVLRYENGSLTCSNSIENWVPVIYSSPELKLNGQNDNISIIFEKLGLPNCSYKVLDNGLDVWFNILADGSALVGLNFWIIPLWLKPLDEYCLDSFENGNMSNSEANSVIVFCELENFNTYIFTRLLFGTFYITSAFSVLITIVIYLIIWDQQSIHGWTQFSFFLSFFAYLFSEGSRIFAKYNGLEIRPSLACFIHAVVAHYFTMVISGTSCMMSLDCFYTFWKLRSVTRKTKKELVFYLFIAWGIPLLALVVGLVLHFQNYPEKGAREREGVFEYAHYRCSSPIWELVFRAQLLLLLVNLLSFIATAYLIMKHFRSTSMAAASRTGVDNCCLLRFRQTVKLFVKLFVIAGTSYLLTAVDLFYGHKNPLGLGFMIIRGYLSLQGVVYLVIFGLPRKNFIRIGRKYPRLQKSRFAWLFKPRVARSRWNSRSNNLNQQITSSSSITNRLYSITSHFRSSSQSNSCK